MDLVIGAGSEVGAATATWHPSGEAPYPPAATGAEAAASEAAAVSGEAAPLPRRHLLCRRTCWAAVAADAGLPSLRNVAGVSGQVRAS